MCMNIHTCLRLVVRASRIIFKCANCGTEADDRPSHYARKQRHFCSTRCYAEYRRDKMQPHEQNSWRGGVTPYEAHKRWVAKNPERMAHLKARRYARERNAAGSHTFEQWAELKTRNENRCAYCGEQKPLTKDHIVPLSEGGSDYIENIQPLCRNCNSRKWKHIYENSDLLEANI